MIYKFTEQEAAFIRRKLQIAKDAQAAASATCEFIVDREGLNGHFTLSPTEDGLISAEPNKETH